jgi:hypothetical protein
MTRTRMMSETLAETRHGLMVPDLPPRRRLLAGLTAGAVALTVVLGTVAPARADDNRDLVKALAAIAIIGVIAHEAGKDRDPEPVEHRRDDDRRHGGWQPPRYQPQPRPRIPAACAIEIEGRDRRNLVVYAESCLRDHGIDRLPRGCARDIRYYGRFDRVYSERCLSEAGFRFGNYYPRGDHERPE